MSIIQSEVSADRSPLRFSIQIVFLSWLIVALIRLPTLPQLELGGRLNLDEPIFWTVAQDISQGGLLYVTTWDHKGPVLFYLLAIPAYLFPSSILAQRIFTSMAVLWSMTFLYVTASLYAERTCAAIGMLFYGVAVSIWRRGLASYAEHYSIALMMPAVYCLCRWRETGGRPWLLWLAGAFAGAVSLGKGNAVLCLLLLAPYLLWRGRVLDFVKSVGHFIGGVTCTISVCIGYLAWQGNLTDFYKGYILFNLAYSSNHAWSDLPPLFDIISRGMPGVVNAFCIAGTLWIGFFFRRETNTERRLSILSIIGLIGGWLSVLIARHPYDQYFMIVVPFAALLAVAVAWRMWRVSGVLAKSAKGWIVTFLTCGAIVLMPFSVSGFGATRQEMGNEELMRTADYISKRTSIDDRIFVIGNTPLLYFLTNRKCRRVRSSGCII